MDDGSDITLIPDDQEDGEDLIRFAEDGTMDRRDYPLPPTPTYDFF